MCRFLHIVGRGLVPVAGSSVTAGKEAPVKRTQILLPDDVHRKLVKQAKARKTSMGELIRQAVERVYVVRLDELALVAYRNGLISLGKLAELSGTHPTRALDLLREKGITPRFGPETRAEARHDAAVASRARCAQRHSCSTRPS
jgi:predicted HTH domain antitoxin